MSDANDTASIEVDDPPFLSTSPPPARTIAGSDPQNPVAHASFLGLRNEEREISARLEEPEHLNERRSNEFTGPAALSTSIPQKRRLHLPAISPKRLRQERGLEFTATTDNKPPQSPLFFSSNTFHRPILPSTFSSSSAGVTMLSKAREEERNPSKVTTLKLARGAFNGSPSRPPGTPGAFLSSDRTPLSQSQSSSSEDRSTSAQLISQLSIVELLEQDERPTFILDLAAEGNYSPGKLLIAYHNAALESHGKLLDLVTGNVSPDSPSLAITTPFLDFKAWAMSFIKGRESLDISLPTFRFANFSWTCLTLRKRFRVFSCEFSPNLQSFQSASGGPQSASSVQSVHVNRTALAGDEADSQREPTDYFGNAVSHHVSQSSPDAQEKAKESSQEKAVESRARPANPRRKSRRTISREEKIPDIPEVTPGEIISPLAAVPTVDRGFFDWTRLPTSAHLPKHIQFARSIDWGSTPLGPMSEWNDDLRLMCNLLMASPHPTSMYWGNELVTIYNEAYVLIAGQKHPKLMGQRYEDAWSEIWSDLQPVFANARLTGQSIMKDDDRLFLERSGFPEESYFSWALIPLISPDGSINGFFNPAFEKTRRKVAERRMLTLREIGEKTAPADDVKLFWKRVIEGIEYNEEDTPFVLVYSVGDDSESDSCSVHSNSLIVPRHCILEGSLGVPEGHPAAPPKMELKTSDSGFCKYFREAANSDGPVVLDIENGAIDPNLLEGIQWRGFGDPCKSVVILSIRATTGESILGFMVIGVNPRRPFDDDYHLFIQLLSRQLATSLASVLLFEAEIRRGQRAARLAAKDKFELSEQLRAKAQEAVESETKFARMAEFAPVGMFIADSTGRITFCNETFYNISRHPRQIDEADEWKQSVKDEDREILEEMWTKVIDRRQVANAEFRFKAPWVSRSGEEGDRWVLASAYPEKHPDGSLKSVFGSITNISQQKWAEDLQRKRREEAMELKRQQENFIDITSHEMRNPLSAILQCADEIVDSLTTYHATFPANIDDNIVIDNVDAAQTIALCAHHQKRIVDDVLTLSKLDSDLLLVTPVDVQPLDVARKALKMFEGELEKNDIQIVFDVEKSYKDLKVDWVRLDPSRLLQVLINLTTNAIKFTHTQDKRTIVVKVGASFERPVSSDRRGSVSYVPMRAGRQDDPTNKTGWGDGEQIFIQFAVTDTGQGLTEDEVKLLFQKFSQASPRTHVQYGGSGLGLFISRQLTELQGGEIGVSSEAGVGSTFAFYIKARRSTSIIEVPKVPKVRSKSSLPSANASRKQSVDVDRFAPAPAVKTLSQYDLSDYQILIVEDNIVNQRVLKRQLIKLKCGVEVANHGAEALDHLKKTTFWRRKVGDTDPPLTLHVVLMDLEMPVMDGLTATRRIRELEAQKEVVRHVPIIAVTANARPEQISTAIDAGMDDVISKPFSIPELVQKIEELSEKFGKVDLDSS